MKISLKAARVNRGLTQQKVAKLLDIDAGTLQRWENGQSAPNIKKVQEMLLIYNVKIEDLIF